YLNVTFVGMNGGGRITSGQLVRCKLGRLCRCKVSYHHGRVEVMPENSEYQVLNLRLTF
ncbi:hypothetical protein BgiBS90_017672, partial [Biomphalaria glabrata]